MVAAGLTKEPETPVHPVGVGQRLVGVLLSKRLMDEELGPFREFFDRDDELLGVVVSQVNEALELDEVLGNDEDE